jgi:predicted HicB family RNase H-like nuclease
MKRNPGRPVTQPTKPVVTLTLRVSKEFKEKLIAQAEAVDLTLTDYIKALVERDS